MQTVNFPKCFLALLFMLPFSFGTAQLYAQTAESSIASATIVPDEMIKETVVVEPASSEELNELNLLPEPTGELEQTASETSESEGIEYEIEAEKLFEKADALEPVLMLRGKPVEKDEEGRRKERLRGQLVPEKHHLNRRSFYYRWVLKTDSGKRIPLKSDLKLLELVRKEELLDNPVMLTGFYIQSAMNENLRYFVVERAVVVEDEVKDE